jgi:outer membrane receptor protein involved in Fe transport
VSFSTLRSILARTLLSVFAITELAYAQTSTGSVQGSVTDQTGALVPGASVALTNQDTGASQNTRTSTAGTYSFPVVGVGGYTLSVSQPGFKAYKQSEFHVEAASPVTINVSLAMGQSTEHVTVSETPPGINTVTASEGNTVTGKQMNELPLTNRQFTQLVLLEPGVSSPQNQTPGYGSNSSVSFSLNGVRSDENNLMIDGIRNLDTFGGNAFVTPNLFAVSEFRIENSSYSAVTGRSAGGQVNLISRSGTNAFHGNIFEFFRNDALNARNFFATSVPENRYNDFGYDVGGPIKKNKLFFFWSEEWRRIIQSNGTHLAVVPTAAERNGDFSALPPGTLSSQYPGNIISPSQLDPNAQLLLKYYYPQPTPGYQNGAFNFVSSEPDFTKWREESLRLDYKPTDKLSTYVRLTQDNVTLQNPYGLFSENALPNVGASSQVYPVYQIAFNATYIFSPTFITEFTWGTYRDNDKYLENGPLSNRNRAPGLNIPQAFPLDELNRIPSLSFSQGYAGITEQWYFHNYSYSMPFESHNTWIHGAHTVQFGIDFTREGKSELANPSSNNTNGTFSFTGQYTGDALADFLTGHAYRYTETALDPFLNYRWYNLEPFIEDQIKLRPNLTLTAGLRYEYYQPEYEKNNIFGSFDPAFFNPAQAPLVNPDGTLISNPSPLNGIIVAGQNSPFGRALFPSRANNLAPRLGLVWAPGSSGKTSVRAGYGIFYDRWGSYSQFGAFNPPFNNSVNIIGTSLSNPVGVAGTLYPPALNAVLGPWKYPQVQKWSASVQRDLGFQTSLSVAYVGTKGTHLLGDDNLNQPYPNLAVVNGSISPDAVRPYPGFSTITAYENRFNSSYNALQVSAIHRLQAGLLFQVSYTYSKTLADSNGGFGNLPEDSRNLSLEKSLATFDVPNVLTFNYAYNLPVFKNSSGFTKAALGGWQVSGITTIQSGFPLTVTLPSDNQGVGAGQLERPDQVASSSGPKTVQQWFNTAAFILPAAGTFGNAPNGAVRGPGIMNWDFGLSKAFPIHEELNLRFRAQFFNIFNHASFTGVDTGFGDVNFGSVTSAASPRLTQLSLEMSF